MEDIFANIESNNLEAAREAVYASLSAKVFDKLNTMKKEISAGLTKEGLSETFKRYKEPTDMQLVDTHTHGKVQAKVYSGYNRYHVKTVVNGKHYNHLDFSSDNKDEANEYGKKQVGRITNEGLDEVIKHSKSKKLNAMLDKIITNARATSKTADKDSLKNVKKTCEGVE